MSTWVWYAGAGIGPSRLRVSVRFAPLPQALDEVVEDFEESAVDDPHAAGSVALRIGERLPPWVEPGPPSLQCPQRMTFRGGGQELAQ